MGHKDTIATLQAQIDALVVGSTHSGHRENATVDKRDAAQGKDTALNKIIALVNASDKSEKKIRERLEREGFEEQEIDAAVDQAKLYGFIDDSRFAEVLIRSRIAQMKGSAGIERELAENDIDLDAVPGWPFEYPFAHEEELERALDLLNRKPPRSKNAREAAYRRLMQKGYPSSVSSSAARIWSESQRGA